MQRVVHPGDHVTKGLHQEEVQGEALKGECSDYIVQSCLPHIYHLLLYFRSSHSHNLEMKHIPGADPELVILSATYEELERYPLSAMKRKEINQLMKNLGFYKKESPTAPVPPEFQLAPARKPSDSKDDL
ncbi:seleno M [Pelobates cultripes]|uniref:Seleno M n=1 Tax=Pelobates cultripes TaxID=61616 RepID=A0AAD1S896_PELCU|nr:seleno M [Pelobates cultripes]